MTDQNKPEEWEKKFDINWSDAVTTIHSRREEIKSFIRTLRDQAYKDGFTSKDSLSSVEYLRGYEKGIVDESVNCKEHCDKAVKEERTKIHHQVNHFLSQKFKGIPRIHEFHERCITNLLSSDYDGTDAKEAQ